MRLSHPSAPFQGVPAEDVFFAANDQYVQMGVGFCGFKPAGGGDPGTTLAAVLLDIKSQPSTETCCWGPCWAAASRCGRHFWGSRAGSMELPPTQFDMLNFYTQNGFASDDAREEHLIQLPSGPAQPPMGCEFASVLLQTVQEQYAFFCSGSPQYRLSPISHDYLTLQMQQPYFMALGYYRGGHPIAEMMMTGASADTAALVMVYVQRDMRRRGVARSLLSAASELLRQRGVTQALTHVSSGSAQEMGLIRMMSGSRRKIITVLPNLTFG